MKRITRKKSDVEEQKLARLLEALETIREARKDLEATNNPTAPLPDQLFHWHRVRQYYDAIKAVANEAEQLSRHMSYEQLPQAFRQSRVNTRSLTLDGIGRFALSSRTTAKVIDQTHANAFLRAYNKGDALREMVPSSTMNSIVAELLREGIEPNRETDGIEANTYAYTSFTKE
jgi:hypothetical protein